jgi:clathrin heavy chain
VSKCLLLLLLLLLLQAIEFGQYEEAFEIYKKFGKKVEAVQVLLTHCKDLDRAHDYANKVSEALRRMLQRIIMIVLAMVARGAVAAGHMVSQTCTTCSWGCLWLFVAYRTTVFLCCLQVDEAPVWSELGHAYLEAGQVPDAIAAYLRSSDSSRYVAVIDACTAAGCYEDLVKYLLMVRNDVDRIGGLQS